MAIVFVPSAALPEWIYAVMLAASVVSLAIVLREFGKRTALLAIVGMLLFAPIVFATEDPAVVVYSDCKDLGPLDWEYWARGCWAR